MKQEKKRKTLAYCNVQMKVLLWFARWRRVRKFSNDFYLIQIAQRLSPNRLLLVGRFDSGRILVGTLERLCPCWHRCFDRLHGSKIRDWLRLSRQTWRKVHTFVSIKAFPPAESPKQIATARQKRPSRVPITFPSKTAIAVNIPTVPPSRI